MVSVHPGEQPAYVAFRCVVVLLVRKESIGTISFKTVSY
jgi:hypothetical protein